MMRTDNHITDCCQLKQGMMHELRTGRIRFVKPAQAKDA